MVVLTLWSRRQKALNKWLDDGGETCLVTNLLWWSVVNPTVCKPTESDVEDSVGPTPNDSD